MPDRTSDEPIRFLETCFQPADWVAIFLKNYQNGRVAQRIAPLSWATSDHVQAWLRAMNAHHHYNVYVGVNAIGIGRRSRTRDAIAAIRHVFLEVDRDGPGVLSRVNERGDLPAPSYVLHSSEDRLHIFWRVEGFDTDAVESLQKRLAGELGADPAATPITQTTRISGFYNHKYDEPYLIWTEFRDVGRIFTPADFPRGTCSRRTWRPLADVRHVANTRSRVERARSYITRVPPAIAGQHGDVHTFRVCCRLVRGFALDDDEALTLLASWNAQCQPPWSDAELRDKLRRARQYGREPIGGLL